MKKITILFFSAIVIAGCNSSEEEKTSNKVERTEADSLYQVIDKGHVIGMSKMAPLDQAQVRAKALLDSIQKLPAKAQEAAGPYKAKLHDVISDIGVAKDKMDKWMEGFKWDYEKLKAEKQIEYLKSEIPKVEDMKASILNSLAKADSLWREKF